MLEQGVGNRFLSFFFPNGGPELKRFFIVFVCPRISGATKMVKKWFSKGTNKDGKKMIKTFFFSN